MDKNNLPRSGIPFPKKIILTISGIFFAVIVFELGLRLGGFIFLSLQEYRNRIAIKQKGSYRIMCLGESTTAGGDFSYPSQLEETLNQRDIGIEFTVINKGVPGVNTLHILASLENNLNQYQPDMVITMMGINDSYVKHYEGIPDAGTRLFQKFKICKFFRIVWRHIANKIREARTYEQEQNKEEAKLRSSLSDGELNEQYPEQISSGQAEDFFKLGKFYRNQGKHVHAEELFKKALELDPQNDWAYVELGWIYINQSKYSQAEETFKKALELNPQNDEAYFKLGDIYGYQRKRAQAEAILKKALELIPGNKKVYRNLGKFYRTFKKHSQAEEFFKETLELNPQNDTAYIALGWVYIDQAQYSQAEESFKKALELNPQNTEAYVELGWIYAVQDKHLQAAEMFKKAIKAGLENENLYRGLVVFSEEIGEYDVAKEYSKILTEMGLIRYRTVTLDNYRKLKEILDKRMIKLVCAQYPMRSIEPLMRVFRKQKDVIFVDNERIFKEAVKKPGYKEYFRDMFAGDFGHCTPKGNKLLAENIAKVILEKCFDTIPLDR